MGNFEKKYNSIFEEIFKIEITDQLKETLVFKQFPQWDSLAQMVIIQRIEEEFDIIIPFEDMMVIDSYKNGLTYILNKK